MSSKVSTLTFIPYCFSNSFIVSSSIFSNNLDLFKAEYINPSILCFLDKFINVTTLGSYDYEYTIKDAQNRVLYSETLTIHIKNPYEFIFSGTDAIYNDHTFNELSLIESVLDHNGVEVTNLTITTDITIDVTQLGQQFITYIISDDNNQFLYEEQVIINVVYGYKINFIDDLSYYITNDYGIKAFKTIGTNLDYQPFRYTDFIESILDTQGNEIELLAPYELIIDSDIIPHIFGYYDVTYTLVSGNEILYKETITIEVKKLVTEKLLESEEIYFFTTGQYDNTFDFKTLVDLYDENGNAVVLDGSYSYEISQIDFNTPNTYQVVFTLYHNNDYIDEVNLTIIIYTDEYDILIDNEITINLDHDSLDPYSYINDILDTNNQSIALGDYTSPNPNYPYGYYQLSSNLQIFCTPLDNQENDVVLIFTIMDVFTNTVHGYQQILVHYVSDYMIEYDNLAIPQYSQIDPMDLIKSIKRSDGTELTINQDVFVTYEGIINTSIVNIYQLTYFIKDSNDVLLYSEDIEIYVYRYYYSISWNNVSIQPGEYTVDTFDPNNLIRNLIQKDRINQVDTELTLGSQYNASIEGFYDLNNPGIYWVDIVIKDDSGNTLYWTDYILKIEYDFDIIFTNPTIELTTFQDFNPYDYVEKVLDQSGNEIDSTQYEIRAKDRYIETSQEGVYVLEYEISIEFGLIYSESIIVNITSPIKLELADIDYIYLNADFVIDDLVIGIFDINHNELGIESGYYYEIESNFDITVENNYYAYITIFNELNQEILNVYKSIEVYSNIHIELVDEVDISDEITSPNDVIKTIYSTIFGVTLIPGLNCHLTVDGTFDLNLEGNYSFNFILLDLDGKILSSFYHSIKVIDANYVKPNHVTIDIDDYIIIPKTVTEETLNLNSFVHHFYDENGNVLDPTRYIVKASYNTIQYGIPDLYVVFLDVYYIGNLTTKLGESTIVYFIMTDDYTFTYSDNLIFNLNEVPYLNELVTSVIDRDGNIVELDAYLRAIYSLDLHYFPGIYEITYYLENTTMDYVYAAGKISIEIFADADIVFTDNTTIQIDDQTFDEKNLILSVNDNQGVEIDPSLYQIHITSHVNVNMEGNYLIEYEIVDLDGITLTRERITVQVFSLYQIDFEYDYYQILFSSPLNTDEMVITVRNQFGNPVDLVTEQLSLTIENPVDLPSVGTREVYYILKDINGELLARNVVTIEIISSFYMYVDDIEINVNGTFNPIDYVSSVYLPDGYYIDVEGTYDLTTAGDYTLYYGIYDINNQIVFRQVEIMHVLG